MKFEFKAYDDFDDGAYHEVTKAFNADTWDEALEMFREFLLGCGYIFNGHFELVEDESELGSKYPKYMIDKETSF